MLAKKEITINGEKWIADFETGTVYKNVTMIPNGTGLLPMSGRYGDYPFSEFRGALYFETGNNFYKIIGDEVLEVSEEEYKEIKIDNLKLPGLDEEKPIDIDGKDYLK